METKVQFNEERVANELIAAGISKLGTKRFTSRYLAQLLHNDEHVMAAVYGRQKGMEGLFGFVEGMLVATDRRVLYIDKRPGYATMDEVSYANVSGIHVSKTTRHANIILYTKIANYKLSYADSVNAQRFADYIESRTIDTVPAPATRTGVSSGISMEALDFMKGHELGVLSSIGRTGTVTGAAVYYTVYNDTPYFMTKVNSDKAANLLGDQHVALTVFDEATLQTIQIQGIVEAEPDGKTKKEVAALITRPRTYADGSHQPPILRMGNDDFIVFRIMTTKYSFIDFKNR